MKKTFIGAFIALALSTIALADGPSLPPMPWDGFHKTIVLHDGPSLPPMPWDGLR